MKTTFENLTQQLQQYSNDQKKCESIILNSLGSNPDLLPDPNELCSVLQDTEYYKKENVYILNDYFSLHEIHPIHLLLSLKEGKELYSRLYDLYVFQQSDDPNTLLRLIEQYKNDPAVTAKQIESFAFDRLEKYSSEISKAFGQTLYLKIKKQNIEDSQEVIPFSILQEREFSDVTLMFVTIANMFVDEKRQKFLNQADLIRDYVGLNILAKEIELFFQNPVYLSKTLEKRWDRMRSLYDNFKNKGYYLPHYLTEGYFNIKNIVSHLQYGEVIISQPENNIYPVTIFHQIDSKDEIFWKNLQYSLISSGDLSKRLLLANKLDITNFSSLIRDFDLSEKFSLCIPPSLHYTLEFSKEVNTWLDSKLKNFVKEFMENLELNDLGYIAVPDKENGKTIIEVLAQRAILKDNKCNIISLSTIYPRALKVLAQLEQKYGIKQSVNQPQKNTAQISRNINLYLQQRRPETKSSSDISKKNRPKQ